MVVLEAQEKSNKKEDDFARGLSNLEEESIRETLVPSINDSFVGYKDPFQTKEQQSRDATITKLQMRIMMPILRRGK